VIEGKPVILVVDDEPLNLAIINEILHDNGFEAVCAENGMIAVELLEKSHTTYSAVLLDRMMPRMDGMAVLSWIKRHPALCDLPVIIQSARGEKEDVQQGLEAGASYYLVKPFNEEQLIAAVRSVVSSCHQNSQRMTQQFV
jgi:DNA-binding response OmpR family regulator